MSNKSAEQRIERSHLQIMKHPSFCAWSGLLFVGNWSVIDNFPTACVNAAGDVKYGRGFVDSLPRSTGNDIYLNFVVLHETGHKALLHLIRGKSLFMQNPLIANIAADHVVNNMILESDPQQTFAAMPLNPDGTPLGCCDVKYKGMSLKEVYDDLMKNAQGGSSGNGSGKGKKGQSGSGGSAAGNGAQGFDQHDPTGGAGQPGQDGDDADGSGSGQALTEEQEQAITKAVEQALRNGSYLAGKQGGNAKRLVGDLLEPKIDWRELLSEFVFESCQGDDEATWKKPMRRFIGDDLYLPSYHQEQMGKIVCGIDVSGSVGDAEMMACLSEVVEICRVIRPSELELLYWDDGIRRKETYKPDQYDQIVSLTKPKGGGGTDLEDVAKYVNGLKDVQCAVILTDGYISGGWRSWNVPVLWVLTTKNMVADCGKSLYIDLD